MSICLSVCRHVNGFFCVMISGITKTIFLQYNNTSNGKSLPNICWKRHKTTDMRFKTVIPFLLRIAKKYRGWKYNFKFWKSALSQTLRGKYALDSKLSWALQHIAAHHVVTQQIVTNRVVACQLFGTTTLKSSRVDYKYNPIIVCTYFWLIKPIICWRQIVLRKIYIIYMFYSNSLCK